MDVLTVEDLARILAASPLITLGTIATLVVVLLLALVTLAGWVASHRRRLVHLVVAGWRWLATLPVVRRAAARVPWIRHAARHLSGRAFLAAHLATGLVLSAGVLGFIRLAEQVVGEAEITRFDLALAQALHDAVTPTGARTFVALTALGSGWALTALGVVVAAILIWRNRRVLAIGWVVAMAGGGVLNHLLKLLYARPRPAFADPLAYESSWSFPSGHSMGTFIACAMLVYLALFALRRRAARLAAVAAAVVWILVIGFSRMYLGVHFFSDVVGGFVAGSVWVGVCITGVEIVRRRRRVEEIVPELG